MEIKQITINKKRNVTLTAILQGVGGEFVRVNRRPSVLILPGGGYDMCAEIEAEPVALAYAKAGYQAFVLRYSVAEHAVWPNPLEDYEAAITMIRNHAEEWHLYQDRIAVIGFSAGGHLAACAAVMSENRPNAAILGYAPIGFSGTEVLSKKGFPDPANHIDEDTCPCFLFAARDDTLVPIKNTLEFQLELAKTDIVFESHIYAYGSHGFSTGERAVKYTRTCNRVPDWVKDSIEWLKDIFGDFGNGELDQPELGRCINDDKEPCLSVDCTISYLKSQQERLPEDVLPLIHLLDARNLGKEKEDGNLSSFVRSVRLREMLMAGAVPEKEIDKIDSKLRKISAGQETVKNG